MHHASIIQNNTKLTFQKSRISLWMRSELLLSCQGVLEIVILVVDI